jgi:hypothetical protein
VDTVSLKGTSALPAMGSLQECGGDERKRIKNGGEGERRMERVILRRRKANLEGNLPFLSPGRKVSKRGCLKGFKFKSWGPRADRWGRPTQGFGGPPWALLGCAVLSWVKGQRVA